MFALIFTAMTMNAAIQDVHSNANPAEVKVSHVALDLAVDFDKRELAGTAMLTFERVKPDATTLVLDTRNLTIESAGGLEFKLGTADAIKGTPLTITLPKQEKTVTIKYRTHPEAAALQWLKPAQTSSKKPLLFTQSQAIEARSWIPIQDTPAVRMTYSATIRTPKDLRAVMSASNDPKAARTGVYKFEMKQAIPAYLFALCVGDLEFKAIGPRTGVYAEPGVVAKAAAEFSDTEDILKACEALYGPYRWDRYDILVMPPSFPFGGMENPRLTFASPTVLAGDKSLVSLVAHELAHSWSGNLVTNATWRDFWLNEGFTVYLERRIMESVYGKERAAAERMLGRRSLEKEMKTLPKNDQILHIDLTNRPPIDGLTDIAYEKGALFLTHLEHVYGREKFDAFLKGYFDHFAFKSITTAEFEKYLQEHLVKGEERANVTKWLYEPGIPRSGAEDTSARLRAAELSGKLYSITNDLDVAKETLNKASVQETLSFLNCLTSDLDAKKMKMLDDTFVFTKSGNSEILFAWLLLAVQNNYEPAMPRLEQFLLEQGRRKFLMPLYEALAKTPDGMTRAKAIYAKARETYHPASVETIDAILNKK